MNSFELFEREQYMGIYIYAIIRFTIIITIVLNISRIKIQILFTYLLQRNNQQ